jgi:LuxR family transcriptional regulator, quorum-sensing system regulator CviR
LDLHKCISKNDALLMLEIIYKSPFCKTEEDFLKLMEEFKKLVYFECSNNGWAEIQSMLHGEKVKCHFIRDGYPDEYLNIYLEKGYHRQDHVMQKYFKNFELQNFSEVDKTHRNESANPVVSLGNDFGIYEGYIYGVCDRDYYSATGFLLAGRHVENNQRARIIIKYLIPHLSVAIKRLLPFPINEKIVQLTSSELEVLKWLKEGKTTWEISSILNKSERVIKFHVDNILRKLNAMNRTHAVAIALENNLISI